MSIRDIIYNMRIWLAVHLMTVEMLNAWARGVYHRCNRSWEEEDEEYDDTTCDDCQQGYHCSGRGVFNACQCICGEIYLDELDDEEEY